MSKLWKTLAALGLFALGLGSAQAAVAVDVCGTHNLVAGATSSNNTGLTISGGLTNSALVVVLSVSSFGQISNPAVTWNGTSMTQIGTVTNGTTVQAFIFGLRNPASGNQTIAASWTTSAQVQIVGCSFQGVSQTSDATAFKNAATNLGTTTGASSVTVTSSTGDMTIAAHSVASGSNITAVSGTSVFIDNSGSSSDIAVNYDNGAATVNMTSTIASSTNWSSLGIDIGAAGAATGCKKLALLGAGC